MAATPTTDVPSTTMTESSPYSAATAERSEAAQAAGSGRSKCHVVGCPRREGMPRWQRGASVAHRRSWSAAPL